MPFYFKLLLVRLRWLERVFRCSVREKNYKKLYLVMWSNYKHICKSVVGQYFKASSDVIEVTMATDQLYK